MAVLERIRSWLYPWQRDWLADTADWKVALKARQIGYTEVVALEALLHALRHDGHKCFLVSTKVENARRQILNRIKQRWLPLLKCDPDFAAALEGVVVNKNSIELPNGSQIIAAAHEPGRLRGNESSSYWLDEFAFWERRIHEELVDAIWPQIESAANPHAVLRIVSTPWTKEGNLYFEIWSNRSGHYAQFSRHRTDIHDAVRQGWPFDIDQARSRMPRDKWNREYLCQFVELGERYFARESLLDCEVDEAPDDGQIYLGIDLGKINDFTAVVVVRQHPDGTYTVLRVYLMRSVSFVEQRHVITGLLWQWDPAETHIDVTAHQSFADNWETVPSIEGVMGDRERKCDTTMELRNLVEEDDIGFQFDEARVYDDGAFVSTPSKVLLDDLCKVKQEETPSGKQRFTVERDDETGHGDSYSALLLGLDAADGGGIGLHL